MSITTPQDLFEASKAMEAYQELKEAEVALQALVAGNPEVELPLVIGGGVTAPMSITATAAELIPLLQVRLAARRATVEAFGLTV